MLQVDALTFHCPLTEHTRNFIGAREHSAQSQDPIS